jgi:hypothetical protein
VPFGTVLEASACNNVMSAGDPLARRTDPPLGAGPAGLFVSAGPRPGIPHPVLDSRRPALARRARSVDESGLRNEVSR